MTKYREILRLKSLGFSERNIAQSCGVSRNTVAKVLKKAAEINLSWPLDFDMTDSILSWLESAIKGTKCRGTVPPLTPDSSHDKEVIKRLSRKVPCKGKSRWQQINVR